MAAVYKCSVTGKFVSKAYAEANPGTTFKQEVKREKKS